MDLGGGLIVSGALTELSPGVRVRLLLVRLGRALVECGASRPGASLRTEIRSRIPTPTSD